MQNLSLKEQLAAVACQLSGNLNKTPLSEKKHLPSEKKKAAQPRWLEHAQYGVELLKAYFPLCFKETEAHPLKVGIKQDLVKQLGSLDNIVTSDKACMVKSLSYYVNTTIYLKSIIAGATRIDLDGNASGIVTAEEEQYSLQRRQTKHQKKPQGLPAAATSQTVTQK